MLSERRTPEIGGVPVSRLSRRQILKLVAAAAGGAALVAIPGCATETPAPTKVAAAPAPTAAATKAAGAPTAAPAVAAPTKAPAAAPTAVKAAQELVVAMASDPGHMDPRVEAGSPGWSIFLHIHDNFVFHDAETAPIPWTVEKWEQVNPTALRFHLKKGIKFHNGEELTAESVKVSLSEIAAPTSRSPWKNIMEVIKDYKISDPYTIDLITATPQRPLLRNTTNPMAMSPRALKELGDKIATNPVGTGQMKFVEYKPGQHCVVEPNPDYWGKKSNFSRIRFRFIPEDGTRMASLEAGEVMMVNNVPPDSIPRLKANPNLDLVVSRTNRVMFVILRCDRKPFDDKRVRQAMNYAVDKEAITRDIMGGMAPMQKAPLPEGVFASHTGLQPYKYDPERAKKLLAEAGATGATFNFGAPAGRYILDKQISQAVAGYLEAVGFKVVYDNPTWSTFVNEITKYDKAKYDGYMFGYGVSTGEPDYLMSEYFYTKNAVRSRYSNPEVDKMIEEGAQNFDEARVKAAYFKAQEIVWEEAPWIFMYEQPDICGINKKLNWKGGRRDERYLFHEASFK